MMLAVIKPGRERPALSGTVAYPVRTTRLLLRPLNDDDVEDVVAYRSRSDVCRWVPFDPMSRTEVLDRIRTSLRQLTDEGQALTAGVELPTASITATGALVALVFLRARSVAQPVTVAERSEARMSTREPEKMAA